MLERPKDQKEFQQREAIGIIRASRFVRKYARSRQPITIQTIREVRREIFREAWPEIGGQYRIENVKITDSKHLPPHHAKVAAAMAQADHDLAERLQNLDSAKSFITAADESESASAIDAVITVSTWIHHLVTSIHPFVEGNGRTARLAANLILERYGLVGISIKVEKENKNRYRQALAQIDIHNDYEPLKRIVYEGLIERYEGVDVKYYT